MSSKLSKYTEGPEARKSPAQSEIQKTRIIPQHDGNKDKNMFAGAVFHNCQFTFTLDAGFKPAADQLYSSG